MRPRDLHIDIGARQLLAGAGALLVTVVLVILALHAARAEQVPALTAATNTRAACAAACAHHQAAPGATLPALITRAGGQARAWGQQVSAMTGCPRAGTFGSRLGERGGAAGQANVLERLVARC